VLSGACQAAGMKRFCHSVRTSRRARFNFAEGLEKFHAAMAFMLKQEPES
jgi:hypothetical protein